MLFDHGLPAPTRHADHQSHETDLELIFPNIMSQYKGDGNVHLLVLRVRLAQQFNIEPDGSHE